MDTSYEIEPSLRYRDPVMPAEWEPHRACWLAWPSHEELWQENLPGAQAEFAAMARAIGADERLEVLVPHERARKSATAALAGLPVRFHEIPFGDIWLRDTAPVFVRDRDGGVVASRFVFNSWGGKYDLPHDPEVAVRVARASGHPLAEHAWVLEGGSVEVDGQGTLLTSRQCLLNANRNPGLGLAEIEERLEYAFGASKILWLDEGLENDHTDGHIDTITRFVGPGRVVCMKASGKSDPNHSVLEAILDDLSNMTDARGKRLEVFAVPSPGEVLDAGGGLMPASYLNFYLSNRTVIVPTYGVAEDERAVQAIASLFPGRKTVGLPSRAILSGGGAFHCITQQEPGISGL